MDEEVKTDPDSHIVSNSLWILAVIIVATGAFFIGRNSVPAPATPKPPDTTTVLSAQTTITDTPTPTIPADLNAACEKTGASEKKDYLKSYTLKEGDTVNSIAEKELGDVSRNTEILTLNDNISKMTIGSILYLPPDNIKSSSGHISEVSGRIVKKDESSWQLSYGGGEKGLGLWMPGYWFKDLPNLADFNVGDCVTVLFDNGVKVYSVTKN